MSPSSYKQCVLVLGRLPTIETNLFIMKWNNTLTIILKDSFFKGPISWIYSAILGLCTLTSTNLFDFEFIKKAHEYLGTTSIILGILILLLLRVVWISASKYQQLSQDLSRPISSEKLTELLFECLKEINAAKTCDTNKTLEHLNNFIDSAKKLFDKATNSRCCVSVKVCINDTESADKNMLTQLTVRNVLRDSSHQRERDTNNYKSKEHRVFENTAYLLIVNNIHKSKYCYICNDIKAMGDNYLNSSIGCYQEEGLPYESEMVTSLRDNINLKKFRGFICVDSESKDVFNRNGLEAIFLRIIADALFGVVPNIKEQ